MPKLAASPFDDSKADLQFITGDDVIFRVYSVVLSLIQGSIFADMLSRASNDGQPIPVTDNSQSFFLMLSAIYPGMDVELDELDTINMLLGLARKYELKIITKHCEKALRNPKLQNKDPYGVFAVAYNFQMTEVMRAAARRTLEYPLDIGSTPSKLLQGVPATAYIGLMQYRERCTFYARGALQECLEEEELVSHGDNLFWSHVQYTCSSACHDWCLMAFQPDSGLYFDYALDLVNERPAPAALLADNELGSTAFVLQEDTHCLRCHVGISHVMQGYRRAAAAVVENAIAKVELKTSFEEVSKA